LWGFGAAAEGEFHESMNLAALWTLPVLFVCENNLYAMGTRIERALSQTDLLAKARTYGMATGSADGMDIVAVEEAARRAADQVRKGNGPFFLECRTYRFRAHSMFDAELYRDKAEVEEWKKRDPIALLRARLEAAAVLDDAAFGQLDAEAHQEIARSVEFAEAGSWEPVEQLTRDVYTPAHEVTDGVTAK
jgi:TPP-dependent pyruvate/acetoin dehydrogenase alpha subunit